MKRSNCHWRERACVLALLVAAPALARAQAPAQPTPGAAAPAAPAAQPPAAPAPAAPAPAPPSPATDAAPAAVAAPAAPAPAPVAAAPAAPAPAATTPAATAIPLAPDPELAPTGSLAPTPAIVAPGPAAVQPDSALGYEQDAALLPMLDLRLGFRDHLIKDDTYDTFSEDDQLPAFHLLAGVCLHTLEGGSALAGVASLELSGSSASLRGMPTELDVLRLGAGPELRLPLGERVYVSGRVSPQAVRVSSRLDPSSLADMSFTQEQWTFGIDASVGADVRIAQARPAGLARPLGLFLRLEAGYAWSPGVELELSSGANGPVRSEALPLGELALHGLSFGASLGVGY